MDNVRLHEGRGRVTVMCKVHREKLSFSSVVCPDCDVGLCIDPCFKNYHTQYLHICFHYVYLRNKNDLYSFKAGVVAVWIRREIMDIAGHTRRMLDTLTTLYLTIYGIDNFPVQVKANLFTVNSCI